MVRCDDWRLGCSLGSFNFTEKLQPEKREKRFSWNWGRCVCVGGGFPQLLQWGENQVSPRLAANSD